MCYIEIEGAEKVSLYYEDYGQGQPVVLIHGWPLSNIMWEYQVQALVDAGYRVVSYDRRGFGKSSRPWNGYDYNTLTDDLKAVIDHLQLQNAILVGFSMGGGEAVRYFSRHGGANVAKLVLLGSVTPYMLKTENNPDGVDQKVFDDMMKQMKEDRIAFLQDFSKQFYGVTALNHPVSAPFLENDRNVASAASPRATLECAKSFATTDFRQDLKAITVPTFIIHGDEDKTVPIESAGNKTAQALPSAQYLVYEGAPHGFFYTEKERLNKDLINFFKG